MQQIRVNRMQKTYVPKFMKFVARGSKPYLYEFFEPLRGIYTICMYSKDIDK